MTNNPFIPQRLRLYIETLRAQKEHLEVRLRKQLPSSLGGRIPHSSLLFRDLNACDMLAYNTLHHQQWSPSSHPLKQYESQPTYTCLGCFWRGQLIAVTWRFPQWQMLGIEGLWVASTYVHPALRKRGIAKHLYNASIEAAREQGHRALYALVDTHHPAAIGSLRTSGFALTNHEEWLMTIQAHLDAQHAKSKLWCILEIDLEKEDERQGRPPTS